MNNKNQDQRQKNWMIFNWGALSFPILGFFIGALSNDNASSSVQSTVMQSLLAIALMISLLCVFSAIKLRGSRKLLPLVAIVLNVLLALLVLYANGLNQIQF